MQENNPQFEIRKTVSPDRSEAVAYLQKLGISPDFLKQWFSPADNSNDLEKLTASLSEFIRSGKSQEDLNRYIDHSPYTIREWASATLEFHDFLTAQQKKVVLLPESSFSYLSCCAEAATHNPIHESFVDVVRQMLDTFGIEGTSM